MHELAKIYKEARYELRKLLRLHEIFQNLRMGDEQISEVLRLAKYHQLEKLQWKVKYLVSEIWKLDMEVKNKKSILATLDEIIEN
jgi:regulator of replication initiation timing